MQGTHVFILLASVALILSSGTVGIRLLLLSRRTGGIPERLMGVGLSLMLCVALPLMAASGMGRAPAGEVRFGLLIAGLFCMWAALTCVVAFTWRTFRVDGAFGLLFTFLLSGLAAAASGGLVAAVFSSPPDMISFEAGYLFAGLLRVPLLGCFMWTGVEGWLQYRMSRRRLALGLADPVVTNRFLLWAIIGFAQSSIQTVSLVLHVQGMGMLASPAGLSVVAVGATFGSAVMLLAFLPPRAYLAFIARRAKAQFA